MVVFGNKKLSLTTGGAPDISSAGLAIAALSVVLILLAAFLIYNQTREVLAQEDPALFCEDPEIPVGVALDQAALMGQQLSKNIQLVLSGVANQIGAAEMLLESADQCQASNCQIGCKEIKNTVLCDKLTP